MSTVLKLHNLLFFFFFFNDTATTEIYTLSLHDALPISTRPSSTAVRIALLMSLRLKNARPPVRSEEHTSELQSHLNLVCRLLLEKKKKDKSSRRVISSRDSTPCFHHRVARTRCRDHLHH